MILRKKNVEKKILGKIFLANCCYPIVCAYVLEHCASYGTINSIWPILKGRGWGWVCMSLLGEPPIPPSTFSTALPIQPNYLSETCGNDLAWLHTFFTLFLSLTFPLWTGPHLSRLLRRLPGRDSEVFPRRATNNNNNNNNMVLITSCGSEFIKRIVVAVDEKCAVDTRLRLFSPSLIHVTCINYYGSWRATT